MAIINRFATEPFVKENLELDLFYSSLIRGKANPEKPLEITTYTGGQN